MFGTSEVDFGVQKNGRHITSISKGPNLSHVSTGRSAAWRSFICSCNVNPCTSITSPNPNPPAPAQCGCACVGANVPYTRDGNSGLLLPGASSSQGNVRPPQNAGVCFLSSANVTLEPGSKRPEHFTGELSFSVTDILGGRHLCFHPGKKGRRSQVSSHTG